MTSFNPQGADVLLSSVSYISKQQRLGEGEVTAGFNHRGQLVSYKTPHQTTCENQYDDQGRLIASQFENQQIRNVYTAKGQRTTQVIKNKTNTVVYHYEYDLQGREVLRTGSDQTERYILYAGQVKLISVCNEWGKWMYRLETLDGQVLKIIYPKLNFKY